MLAALLKVVGLDVRREVQQLALTVVFALLGAVAAIVALAIGLRALYLWLELALGIFPALGIVGAFALLLAIIFFLLAFMPRRARRRVRVEAAGAVPPPPRPAVAAVAEQAVQSTEEALRTSSRSQLVGTLVTAVIAGWILGKRM